MPVRAARCGRAVTALAAVAAVGALLGCGPSRVPAPTGITVTAVASPDRSPSAPPAPQPAGPVVVASGLQAPWSIVFVDDVALISERGTARVLELDRGDLRVVGTLDGVVAAGESGLLGLAIDAQDRLYAYSTGPDGNRIQRFALTGGPGTYGLGPAETILDGLPSATVHDGGRIAFGPDGMLYAGVGDAGDQSAAQDLDRLGGKILRMTPDGQVPADNPFPGSLVYSYGHRNVQGLAWAADGTMVASEFGQDTWDELNLVVPGATTAGRRPRVRWAWPGSSTPCCSGTPTRRAPAASRSPTAWC
ncbi:PQQ-dependent sugar dehydrogenase [Cellulomonas soli]